VWIQSYCSLLDLGLSRLTCILSNIAPTYIQAGPTLSPTLWAVRLSTRNDVAVSSTFTSHDDDPELHSFHFRKHHQRAQSMPKAHTNGIPMMTSVSMMLCFGLKTLRSFEVLPHRLEEDVYIPTSLNSRSKTSDIKCNEIKYTTVIQTHQRHLLTVQYRHTRQAHETAIRGTSLCLIERTWKVTQSKNERLNIARPCSLFTEH
jgi:hypothetical protein